MSSKKRKASISETSIESKEPNKKCLKLEDCGSSENYIFRLSDDILLDILKFVTSSLDIINTSETCLRLQTICADKSLWKKANFRGRVLSLKLLKTYLKKLNSETKYLAIEGCLQQGAGLVKTENLSEALLRDLRIKCRRLSTLILDKCFIDAYKVKMFMLPSNIQHLSITDTQVVNTSTDFFNDIHTVMPGLTSIDLSYSDWVPHDSLLAFCKCPNLAELRLRGCFRMGECVSYTSIACQYGFKKVTLFDLRNTEVDDRECVFFFGRPMVKTMLLGKDVGDNSTSRITDKSVMMNVESRRLNILETLSLRGTKITDVGLKAICDTYKSLKMCDLRGTSVSQAGVTDAKMRRLNCQFLSDF